MLINFVDATNDANHYTKPPPKKCEGEKENYRQCSGTYKTAEIWHLVSFVRRCFFQVAGVLLRHHVCCGVLQSRSLVTKCLIIAVWGKLTLYKYVACWLIAVSRPEHIFTFCLCIHRAQNKVDAIWFCWQTR